jgi:SAM-dependent methyltransferase
MSDPGRLRRSARAVRHGWHVRVTWRRLRRREPFSRRYGFDLGTPIDRRYLHDFFARHSSDIRGDVLEVGSPEFSAVHGREVSSTSIVDIDGANPAATIVADLATAGSLPAARFDCAIVPQTLQYVADPATAVRNLTASLRPGGVLLVTVPSVAKVDHNHAAADSWRMLPPGLEHLAASAAPDASITVTAYGNLLATVAFLNGLPSAALRDDELWTTDPEFPMLSCLRVELP